ncbi:MAG: 2-iminoacetate synthase ThiH [Candidatus Omnitrophica bacterium]|nr:2-iminoacetate synthase ThiH [Candidatus Omnitrophota bacterium]
MTGFYEIYKRYDRSDIARAQAGFKEADIRSALAKDAISASDYLALLSASATPFLEDMARRSRDITLRNFGRAIQLYAPLYLSDHCDNECVYCGFKRTAAGKRRKLDPRQAGKEAEYIASLGIRHMLLLTGGSRKESPLEYIRDSVLAVKEHVPAVSLEIYPLETDEYRVMVEAGADGLTVYQETYDEELYDRVHLSGPKKDYLFRMDAPERAALAGMRAVNIGVLFGLGEAREDAFFMGRHAEYLQEKYPACEISVSVPRLRAGDSGSYRPRKVTDSDIVQIITAARLFLPRSGITVSTRETAEFRDNIVSLGVTRMSAGSVTAVGGYAVNKDKDLSYQFHVSDDRDISAVRKMLESKGYQAVFYDHVP